MGKYIGRAKTAGKVAVMEVNQASLLGVRTRAKTLALQKAKSSAVAAGGSYLQLRSRRLEKPALIVNDTSRRGAKKENNNWMARGGSRGRKGKSGGKTVNDVLIEAVEEEKKAVVEEEEEEAKEYDNDNKNLDIEASLAENVLDSDARERGTREWTPCSLTRDPEILRTPGSSNRPTSSMQNREDQISACRLIPTAREMDKFFGDTEKEHQRQFIEKYNYDPVNDKPLPGHFEWQKVDP